MKLLILALVAVSGVQAYAQDSFTIEQNGQRYLCRADSVNPGGAIACIDRAYAGPFSREESTQLCTGARSAGPAECAILAYSGTWNRTESLNLCRGAYDTGPALCAQKAYAGPFNRTESLELCNNGATEANAVCAINAYSGSYSRAEALRLCSNGKSEIFAGTGHAIDKVAEQKLLNLEKQVEREMSAREKILELKISE
jgi:hypothetical protein